MIIYEIKIFYKTNFKLIKNSFLKSFYLKSISHWHFSKDKKGFIFLLQTLHNIFNQFYSHLNYKIL